MAPAPPSPEAPLAEVPALGVPPPALPPALDSPALEAGCGAGADSIAQPELATTNAKPSHEVG
jgi:hypothetical protein